MSDLSDWRHLSASEFPNDNPALHDGAIWVCFAPCGPLRPVVRPRAGGRPSTIPAPLALPVGNAPPALTDVKPEDAVQEEASAPESEESVTEVTRLAAPADNDGMPSALELAPADALEVHPPLLDLAEDDVAAPEGCSLSAGLKPPAMEAEPAELKVSEMRARPDAAAPAEALETMGAGEDPEARRTILPPPSEETRTLMLTRIHVPGRSQAPSSVEGVVTASATSPKDVASAPQGAEPEHSRPDPFAAFVTALVEVALAAGATRAAAVLPGFLDGVAQDSTGFPDAVRTSMLESGLASEASGSLAPSAAFAMTANAWRLVLRGETNDFSACGTSTLDAWASDLLKSFGAGRDGKVDVKRELRRRGVAAFGMILAA